MDPENNDKTEELEDQSEFETLDFNKPDFIFQPKELHDWRQMGPYLVCKSCDLEHAVYIGLDQLLVGLNEDGTPLLKQREVVNK